MEKKIVVIGGVACGPKSAARARRLMPNADITIIERGDLLSYGGCGMPYYIQGEIPTVDELMSTAAGTVRDEAFFKSVKAINVKSRTLAEKIHREEKKLETVSLETGEKEYIEYDKLVLATGADAFIPELPGRDLKGVFKLNHPNDADDIKKATGDCCKNVVIVGAGLIGLEVAEALTSNGHAVTVVEMMDSVVPAFVDPEIAAHLEKHLKSKGVNVMTATKVQSFTGDDLGQVTQVVTDKGEIDANVVLVAIGVKPNSILAGEAGLEIGERGAIRVNEYLQTSDPDIYAGGDCVENKHLITGKPVYMPLGSTANKHGRIIGDNLAGGSSKFPGVLGTAIFKAFDMAIGRVGLAEKDCAKEGLECVSAITPGPDRAHYYPAAKPIILKMTAEKKTGKLVGVQAIGAGDVAKRIDVAATALYSGLTIHQISELDLAYAPPYSSAVDILSHAANVVDNKMHGVAKGISPHEIKQKMANGDDFILLDVRSSKEIETLPFTDDRVVNIPLGKLRERLLELPKDKEIVAFCKISLRGYEAQTILEGAGFNDVKFLDGGVVGWPY